MYDIIVAFPKIEDAKSIKNMLVQNGVSVSAVANSGAQVISITNELDGGIVICGYRFRDMYYHELKGDLPTGFSMLLVASPAKLKEQPLEDLVCISMPFKTFELLDTVDMMTQAYRSRRKRQREKPTERSLEERKAIDRAKSLLMERNHMSETEAHRYLQKTSMDSGNSMAETARMFLALH